MRLLLGSDVIAVAGAVQAARAEPDARWRPLSESTDHDDWPPAHLDALREMTG